MSVEEFEGEYEPSTWDWVREQAGRFESSGGTEANTLRDTGMPIMMVTCRGHKSGKVRKVPLIYGRDGDDYVLVASKGGAPENPGWYENLLEHPEVDIQVRGDVIPVAARTGTAPASPQCACECILYTDCRGGIAGPSDRTRRHGSCLT